MHSTVEKVTHRIIERSRSSRQSRIRVTKAQGRHSRRPFFYIVDTMQVNPVAQPARVGDSFCVPWATGRSPPPLEPTLIG